MFAFLETKNSAKYDNMTASLTAFEKHAAVA